MHIFSRVSVSILAFSTAVALCPAAAQTSHYRSSGLNDAKLSAAAPVQMETIHAQDTLHIVAGQSTILRGVLLKRVYVSNPAVLQTFTPKPDELVVTAKTPGASSLILWDTMDRPTVYNVSADLDPMTLRVALDSQFPNNNIQLQGNQDLLTLTGTVSSAEMVADVTKLAAAYSKNVANSLRVVSLRSKQVELKLQILEVDRSKLEQFGFNLFRPAGSNLGSISTQQFATTATTSASAASAVSSAVTVSNPLNFFLFNAANNVGVTVQDLEEKNVAQILAEPTLTTMSGQQAHFLSGGEFPFPVVQGGTGNSTAITIQFRPYGVKMDFMPVVNDDGSIRVKISPEVSALDYSNAVTISGFTIPAISTRRAETEVELRDGQTFAISGLLDHRTTEILSKMPGIGDVPLLGQLFRSKNLTHSMVELVVLVHVRVLDPVDDESAPHKPVWAVPNMDQSVFDKALHRERPNDVPPSPQPIHPEQKQ